MRDHVLGIRAVTGHGEAIHSGGRVLKNVTGLDLCKLLTGSHGTLGVITEVTLKVLPAPAASGTIVLPGVDAAAGVAALSAALGSPYSVSAAAWLPAEAAARVAALAGFGGAVALARIEDMASSVAYRTARLRDDLGSRSCEILDDVPSRAVWRAIRDLAPLLAEPADAVWRISVRPSAGPAVLRTLADGSGDVAISTGAVAWPGSPAPATARPTPPSRLPTAAGGTWLLMRGH